MMFTYFSKVEAFPCVEGYCIGSTYLSSGWASAPPAGPLGGGGYLLRRLRSETIEPIAIIQTPFDNCVHEMTSSYLDVKLSRRS